MTARCGENRSSEPKSATFFRVALVPLQKVDSLRYQKLKSCGRAGNPSSSSINTIMGAEATRAQERLEKWAQRLQNLTVSPLTRDYPETQKPEEVKRTIEAFESLTLPQDAQAALKKLSQSSESAFSTFLTAFVVLVARLTGDEDIAIGTSSADDGRPFVLRVPINPSESFEQLRAKVTKVHVSSFLFHHWF